MICLDDRLVIRVLHRVVHLVLPGGEGLGAVQLEADWIDGHGGLSRVEDGGEVLQDGIHLSRWGLVTGPPHQTALQR